MTKMQRIRSFLLGLVIIIFALGLPFSQEYGYALCALVLSFSLLIYGIRALIYYFSMARHMVGGKVMLYFGIIVLDFGAFTLALTDVPKGYLILYLLGVYAFTGAIGILRGLEAKRNGSRRWRRRVITGVISLLLAVLALIFGVILRAPMALVTIYSIGLFLSGCTRIAAAFRRTAVVYIA